ncbi:MAG: hypothetical protein JSS10_02055 [Verrucomicrobia bacterium]|nr:hypothetical protein [Verrucomicrobiota bacterium]
MVAAARGKRCSPPSSYYSPSRPGNNRFSFPHFQVDPKIARNIARMVVIPPLRGLNTRPGRMIHFSSLRVSKEFSLRRFYNTRTATAKHLTTNEKEKIKELIKHRQFDTIDETVKEHQASSSTDLSFFIGQEFFHTAEQFLESHPSERLGNNEYRVVKKMLSYAEKYMLPYRREDRTDLLAKVYYLLGRICTPKNNYEAIYYYNHALKHLSYEFKQKSLPDYEMDLSPIEVLERVPSELLPEINTALGKAAFLEGNLASAQKYLDKAVSQDPKNVEALVHLGCLAWMKKGFAQSGKYFDKAFAVDRAETSKWITEVIFFTLPHVLCCANLEKKPKAALHAPVVYPDALMNYRESLVTYDHLLHTDPHTSKYILDECQKVFDAIHSSIENSQLRSALTAELLLKEVAFHSPKKGKEFLLPSYEVGQDMLAYKVDEVIRLRGKIPAYGLTSSNASPILIYRGTAPALSREGGISSLIEDLDPKGVGRQIFDHAFPRINSWLEQATEKGKKAARILGYSQGASLAALTAVHSHHLISKNHSAPSITFNPPGIDNLALENWKKIALQERPTLVQYLVKGDLVSRCGGALIGEAYEIATAQKLGLLDAHVSLVLPQSHWKMYPVDTEKDNQAALRKFAAGFVETKYGFNLYDLLQSHPAAHILLQINALTSNSTIGQGINYALRLGGLVNKLLHTKKA